jgi:hypothetical protein
LEHVIRAACSIADDDDLIIVGSQSILGQFPDAPAELLASMEVGVLPMHRPERAELIEGSIGELSLFHETFGYYADGIDSGTATLPDAWRERLVCVSGPGTNGKRGWTLEAHDLVLSKYVAGREKDRVFNQAALRHGLVSAAVLRERLRALPVEPPLRDRIERDIERDATDGGR